jgi:signal transduction histidine kinase
MQGACFQKLLPWCEPLWGSLRAKFITVIVIVQLSVMGLVTVVIEHRQRATILTEARKRAVSLATHLAALSEGYILSYNFVKLEQTVEQVAAEEDVTYAIIQLHNGTVAAYSAHPEQQGRVLNDLVSQRALQADEPFIQVVQTAEVNGEGYDVAIPIFTPGGIRKWGVVRIGLSLADARHEIRTTSRGLFLLGIVALVVSSGGASFLAMRISRPVQHLVTGVNAVAQGNYDHAIAPISCDEVGHLAQRFEEMRQALRLHITHLAEEKQRLERANTTIKETQTQLIQSEKLAAVGKLAAKVAHEVNNPLAIIKTSMHLINKKMASEDPNKENLDIIEEEIARIARIIRELLDFARPARELSALQVNEVIRKLMKLVDEDLPAWGVASRLDLAADLPVLYMSTDQLKQVLLNLIKNAKEAMPKGGTLLIRTARVPGGVTISVSDTGMGIPEKHLRSLFELFFSTKKEGEGMGLGLAVSYSIIKGYGGSIEVESQVGEGTTFCVFLPEYPPIMVGDVAQREATTVHERSKYAGEDLDHRG